MQSKSCQCLLLYGRSIKEETLILSGCTFISHFVPIPFARLLVKNQSDIAFMEKC